MARGASAAAPAARRRSGAAGESGERLVRPLSEVSAADLPLVGGKNASLGEMLRSLSGAGVRVPDGFALCVEAFHRHLREAGLVEGIHEELDRLDCGDLEALSKVSSSIRARIEAAPLPDQVRREVLAAYRRLRGDAGREFSVAVRSSATAEDLPEASFAGQQESFLGVRGERALLEAVRRCLSSLFTARAIAYRSARGIAHRGVGLSVGVQRMVASDRGAAGVLFTLDPESGFAGVVLVQGSWGLGEAVVLGRTDPDEFILHKAGVLAGRRAILLRRRGEKRIRRIIGRGGEVREGPTPPRLRRMLSIDDDELLQLARWGIEIERHASQLAGVPRPMDVEWAKDGRSGELFILQARPETVHAARAPLIEFATLKQRGEIRCSGAAVGSRIAVGPVRIVRTPADAAAFTAGEVLVAETTDPDAEPLIRKAVAVVTDHGGRTCHAAIVSREAGIPCVVGCGDATRRLADGEIVTVSCAEGAEGRVYAGQLRHEVRRVDPATLPRTRVPLMLNLADPGRAFPLAALPAAGVGLLRIEFVIAREIGIHPLALLADPQELPPRVRSEIRRRCAGFDPPSELFVTRLAEGIARIAAAFHPRPVTVRLGDFKSDEYAGLIGGERFEPRESNPMLGLRGAARYRDPAFREAFSLECAAIRRVREEIGLDNLRVMVPFCRTLREADGVLAEMASHGLRRGEGGLEVWVMCEIPSNALLASEFAERFDAFSIGSNDLTQLTLGIDRDSERLAGEFDERDPAVKSLIAMAIAKAHAKGRPVGICGEAPSNDPAFAGWLVDAGIDSISVNPDAFAALAAALAAERRPLNLKESGDGGSGS